ncbi:DUF1003 domain-containing protein [Aquidulcibacter paucihalophilus]|uniref:DUF1003 domain-containing protein n=1 Tax=Aquidulcibacter paucihalophilus TaxID=1978549 RepID=UPI001E630514|nr:DUF1003 domain-containing protein [Aquidulcibacter paucihalophilus]
MTQSYTSATVPADQPPSHAHMLGQILLEEGGFARLSAKDQALVCAIAHRVHSTQDANEAFELQTTFGQKLADRVAEVGGSWGFVIGFCVFLVIWALLNLVILHGQARFDPYPFIFLNLILSMLAAIQAPIIMMAQNRQAEKDRLTTRMDYEVNVKAEHEIALLRQHITQLHDKLDRHLAQTT